MNAKVKQAWEAAAAESADDSWEGQQAFMQRFAQQIVGETVLALLCTDCRDVVYTTHDKSIADGVVARAVEGVRRHWGFQ
jgi:hypothetical protein